MSMTLYEIRDTIRDLCSENAPLNPFLCTWGLRDKDNGIELSSRNVSITIPVEEVGDIRVDGFGYLVISTRGFCGSHIIYSLNAEGDVVKQKLDIPFAVHDFLKELNKVLDESGRELVARINKGDDLMIGEVIIPRHGLRRILMDPDDILVLVYNDYFLQFRTKKVIKNE